MTQWCTQYLALRTHSRNPNEQASAQLMLWLTQLLPTWVFLFIF